MKAQRGQPTRQIALKFKGKHARSVNIHRPPVALLRIGYLWAFSVFGYGFLANPNLQLIRRLIRQPDEPAARTVGVSEIDTLPQDILGVSLVRQPAPLQSFMIAFYLHTPLNRYRYGVLLPGPTHPGLGVYTYLASAPGPGSAYDLSVMSIPEDDALLDEPQLAMASAEIWSMWRDTW